MVNRSGKVNSLENDVQNGLRERAMLSVEGRKTLPTQRLFITNNNGPFKDCHQL